MTNRNQDRLEFDLFEVPYEMRLWWFDLQILYGQFELCESLMYLLEIQRAQTNR